MPKNSNGKTSTRKTSGFTSALMDVQPDDDDPQNFNESIDESTMEPQPSSTLDSLFDHLKTSVSNTHKEIEWLWNALRAHLLTSEFDDDRDQEASEDLVTLAENNSSHSPTQQRLCRSINEIERAERRLRYIHSKIVV